MYVNLAYFGT